MLKRTLVLLLAIALLHQQSVAAPYSVTDPADTNADTGTFRDAVEDSIVDNNASDTIDFNGLGGPATITLGSDLPEFLKSPGATVDFLANSPITIEGGANRILNLTGGGLFNLGNNIILNGSHAAGVSVGMGTVLTSGQGINTGLTLDGGLFSASETLTNAGVVTLEVGGGTVTASDVGETATFSGQVTGVGQLIIDGDGTVVLNNTSNDYAGGTIVNNGGTLSVTNDAALGNLGGDVTLNAGTLATTTGINSARDVALNGGGTVNVSNEQTTQLTGAISGTGGLNASGPGTLVLDNVLNNYTGGTAITGGGTVRVSADENLGDASGSVAMNNGTLALQSAVTTARDIVLAGSGGTISNVNGNVSTLSGQITGSGGINFTGDGTFVLSDNSNDYTGGTTINAQSIVSVSDNAQLGDLSGGISLNSGTLRTTDGLTTARNLTLNGGGTVNVDGSANITTLASDISGTGGLNVSGNGTLVLSNAGNSYTGGTVVQSGMTLSIANDAHLGDAAGGVTLNGSTLTTTTGIGSARTLTLGVSGGTVDVSAAQTTTLSADVAGTGNLTKAGDGTLTLSGGMHTGDTAINAGTFNVDTTAADEIYNGDFTGSGILAKSGTGILTLTGSLHAGNLVTNAGTLRIDTTANNMVYGGAVSGAGVLGVTGSNVLTLTHANTHSGETDVSMGTLAISNSNQLGSGTLSLLNGNLDTAESMTIANALSVTSNGAVNISRASNTVTLSGLIADTGTLVKNGGGTLVLSNAGNTYSGGTTISSGVVSVAADGALGNAAGVVTIDNDATLRTTAGITSARNMTIGAAGGNIDVSGAQTTTLNGAISGGGALTKIGSGILILGGSNSYNGDTSIEAGELRVSNNNQLGAVTSNIAINNGTLTTTAATVIGRNISIGASGGTLSASGVHTSTITGNLSGTSALTKTGAGTITLAGSLHTGDITISAGTLNIDGSAAQTMANNISGAGILGKSGSGTLTLSGTNNHSGGTSATAGAISISNNSQLGTGILSLSNARLVTSSGFLVTSTMAISNGASVEVTNGAHTTTLSGQITGTGGLTKAGMGTLVLSNAANNYTGGTSLSGGGTTIIAADGALGNAAGGLVLTNGSALRTTAGFTSSRAVTIGTGGGIFDVAGAHTSTFNGNFSGSGALTKTGAGTLTLAGALHSGNIVINQGTLDLNTAAGDKTFANSISGAGNLSKSGVNTMTLTGTVNYAGATAISQGTLNFDTAATIGALSGSGALQKSGSGTLTINGANTHTGQMTVSNGSVVLGAANSAGGAWSVASGATLNTGGFNHSIGAMTNAGTVALGAGKLRAASYAGGGRLSLTLSSADPALDVTGVADLAGGTLEITTASLGTYTIVNAGTLTGVFDSILVPAGMRESSTYSGTDLILTLALATFARPGQDANQLAIVDSLNANVGSGGDMGAVLAQLGAFSDAEISEAVKEMSPVSLDAMSGLTYTGADVQSAAVGQRMTGLQAGNVDGSQTAYFDAGRSPAHVLIAAGPSDVDTYVRPRKRKTPPAPRKESPWGVFGSALASSGNLDDKDAQPGYSFSVGGGIIGVDYRVTDGFIAGLSGGFVRGTADINEQGGDVTSSSFRYGVYSTAYNDRCHLNLYVGGASDSFDTSRNIPRFTRVDTGDIKGTEFNAAAQTGVSFNPKFAQVAPFVGVNYDRLRLNQFTEEGAGALNLNVAAQTAESVRSSLGVKLSRAFFVENEATLIPFLSAAWQHEFEDQQRTMVAQFAAGGGSFSVDTAEASRNGALVNAGIDIDWVSGFSGRFAYLLDWRSDFISKTISASARYRF